IVPEFQTRSVGNDVWMAPKYRYGGQARMVIARLDSGRAMVLVPPRGVGYFMDEPAEGTWSFIVEPVDTTTTRLILGGRSGPRRTFSDHFWNQVFWEPAHFIMECKLMMT